MAEQHIANLRVMPVVARFNLYFIKVYTL